MTTLFSRVTRSKRVHLAVENDSTTVKIRENSFPSSKSKLSTSNPIPQSRSALEDISNKNKKRKLDKVAPSSTSSTPSPTHVSSSASELSPTSTSTASLTSPSSVFSLPPAPVPVYNEVDAATAIREWTALPPTDYSDGIFTYLYKSEMSTLPSPLYMDNVQGDLSHPMRSILIDWLVEVSEEYKLQSQTFYLAVSYLDRFLSQVAIDRSRLQLVGITCMLTAAKYWEICPPCVEDFVYISDHTYSRQQLLEMESALLTTLSFRLAIPTSWEFARRLTRAAKFSDKVESLVDYILELFTQSSRSLWYRPSLLGASAVFLALHTLNTLPVNETGLKDLWPQPLPQLSHYSPTDMKNCVIDMNTMLSRAFYDVGTAPSQPPTGMKAVKEKYTNTKKHGVSKIKPRSK